MDYKVIEDINWMELSVEIRRLKKEGWKLQGGISVYVYNTQRWYAQALVWEDS